MMLKWTIAAAGAFAIALLAARAPMPWRPEAKTASTAAVPAPDNAVAAACSADRKAANLNFTLNDLQNKPVKLADYKGRVIVLDFWATWCGPCKLEIPWFEEMHKNYGAQGLQMIGVSVDDKLKDLLPYVADMKMNYPVLVGKDRQDVQDAYGPLVGIPVSVIIARDGNVCTSHAGLTGKETFEYEIKALL